MYINLVIYFYLYLLYACVQYDMIGSDIDWKYADERTRRRGIQSRKSVRTAKTFIIPSTTESGRRGGRSDKTASNRIRNETVRKPSVKQRKDLPSASLTNGFTVNYVRSE